VAQGMMALLTAAHAPSHRRAVAARIFPPCATLFARPFPEWNVACESNMGKRLPAPAPPALPAHRVDVGFTLIPRGSTAAR